MRKQPLGWHRCVRWTESLGQCPYLGQRIHDSELPRKSSDIKPPRMPPGVRAPSIPRMPGFKVGWDELEKMGDEDKVDPSDEERKLWEPPKPPVGRKPEEKPVPEPFSSGKPGTSRKQKEQPGPSSRDRSVMSLLKREAEVYTTERLNLRTRRRKEESEDSERRRRQEKNERTMIPQGFKATRVMGTPPVPKKAVPGADKSWRYITGGVAAGLTSAAIYQLGRGMGRGGGIHFPSRPGEPQLTPSRY